MQRALGTGCRVVMRLCFSPLSRSGTPSPPGVASPSLAEGLANQQFAVLFCLALTKALEVAQGWGHSSADLETGCSQPGQQGEDTALTPWVSSWD